MTPICAHTVVYSQQASITGYKRHQQQHDASAPVTLAVEAWTLPRGWTTLQFSALGKQNSLLGGTASSQCCRPICIVSSLLQVNLTQHSPSLCSKCLHIMDMSAHALHAIIYSKPNAPSPQLAAELLSNPQEICSIAFWVTCKPGKYCQDEDDSMVHGAGLTTALHNATSSCLLISSR